MYYHGLRLIVSSIPLSTQICAASPDSIQIEIDMPLDNFLEFFSCLFPPLQPVLNSGALHLELFELFQAGDEKGEKLSQMPIADSG